MKQRKCWCGERHENHTDGHHCYDWDYLYIRSQDPEYESCVCGYKPMVTVAPSS